MQYGDDSDRYGRCSSVPYRDQRAITHFPDRVCHLEGDRQGKTPGCVKKGLGCFSGISGEAGTQLSGSDINVLNTVTRVPIIAVVYEWKGLLHFKTEEIGCENSITPAILEIAGEHGISGRMVSVSEACLDTFPLEELYCG